MKVWVDARLLSRPLTGIGRYTLEMCRALSNNPEVVLYLYSPSPLRAEASEILASATIRSGCWNNGLLRQLWTESYLPLWAKKDQVDLFWGPAHRLPCLLPGSMASVVTIHDLVWKYAGETMRPLSRLLERCQMPNSIRMADQVVTDSRATADSVKQEFHINGDKLSVVPLGANSSGAAQSFEVLHEKGIDRPYFLFVGTLEPRKNLVRLLLAYAQLPESSKTEVMLVIAGGRGWGGIDIQAKVSEFGLEEKVLILGYVDEPTLATLYANALFLAMPSLYEGFGLPLVEAMVHGTPVLTANNSSMPEVAGNAGVLVDAFDIKSIQMGLSELIANHDLRKTLADNTQANVARFNWHASAEQLVSVFEKAIADKKG